MVSACGKSVFFDQLVQLRSEQGGVAEPDVPVWLLMIGRPQAAALDLPEKQGPQVRGEGIAGPCLELSGAVAEAIAGGSQRVTVSSGLAENKT